MNGVLRIFGVIGFALSFGYACADNINVVATTIDGATVINADQAAIVGSDLQTGEAGLHAVTQSGDLTVVAAKETQVHGLKQRDIAISMDQTAMLSAPQDMVKVEDGRLTVSLGTADYREHSKQSTTRGCSKLVCHDSYCCV